jgi:crotonobetainyl-CoA:carnitine CoA-transferase CaiB-like acyl-CoA transferase
MKPLAGVTVLDLTRYLAGPYCTLLLAGLGAKVIKVEPPGGEPYRERPPFGGPRGAAYEKQTAGGIGMAILHRARNKKSITLNLRHPEGVRLFKDLCRAADVVVENYAPGVLDQMGMGYSTLRTSNPRLILCSISGFGQTGPLREWRAYDPVIQAMSGISSVTGYPDRPPVRCGAAVSDTTAPLFAVIGILAALRQREQSGRGEWIDIAMLDTSLFLLPEVWEYFIGGLEPQRRGNDHAGGSPFNMYAARDGYITVAVVTNKDWQNLPAAIGREDLRSDKRFATLLSRRQHIQIIENLIQGWIARWSREEAVTLLQQHHVPAGPVYTLPELLAHPQLLARQMVVDLAHPSAGVMPGIQGFGMPIRFAEQPLHFDQPAPLPGAHNTEIYQRLLGLNADALKRLHAQGVI